MLALHFLCVAFAGGVLCSVEVTRASAPAIGREVPQTEGFQERLEIMQDEA